MRFADQMTAAGAIQYQLDHLLGSSSKIGREFTAINIEQIESVSMGLFLARMFSPLHLDR
jgi:hypothetical protein